MKREELASRTQDIALPFARAGEAAPLAPPRALRESRPDGSFVLRHPDALRPHALRIGDWLAHWAAATPDAPFLAERSASATATPEGWSVLSYAQARTAVGELAQGLLDLGLPRSQPIAILSDNSLDHALLALAALQVGIPVCGVSSAYSKAKDHGRIRAILDTLDPSLVYAAEPRTYGPALTAWGGKARTVFSQGAETWPGALALADLRHAETPAVAQAFAAVQTDDDAKYLLTSGSTGTPKVVVNSHRMLTANQQQMAQAWPFLTRQPPRLLDWLPWSHTFGANHNLHMVLAHGGSLWIDDGRPAPGLIERTVANLRTVKPNLFFNVPRGFEVLLPYLEQDDALAQDFFGHVEGIFYAAAALPQALWERIDTLARKVRGQPVWLTSSWGATETAPALTTTHWPTSRAGCIGLPLPGVEIKFVPGGDGGKLELRVRGPNVFRHYRNAPAATAAAFDEEGFYRIGDAGRLMDPDRPEAGIAFDGRVAEDFKLSSGTWVSVGTLRVRAVSALAPYVSDAVIAGHDRDEVGLLVFPSPAWTALPEADRATVLAAGLQAMRAQGGGSSQTPTRLLVLDSPPSIERGEITDKGYLNQRAVLAHRADAVQQLFAPGAAGVIR